MASHFPMPVRQSGAVQRMPLDPLLTVQRDMDSLFGNLVRSFMGAESRSGEIGVAPRVDVSETAAGLTIDAELPGAVEQEVEVSLDRDDLVIAGEIKREHHEQESGYRIAERQVGRFSRSIHLPFEPDPDKIVAQFHNGLLTVTIARPAQMDRPKRIALTSGDRGADATQQQAGIREQSADKHEAADA